MTAFNWWLVRQNHYVCGCLIVVGFASWKQTFPDVETILHLLTLKRERIPRGFFWFKRFLQPEISAEEACVYGISTLKEALQSSLGKYTQAQMIFKGFACLYLPCCSTRPLSMTPRSPGSDPWRSKDLGDSYQILFLFAFPPFESTLLTLLTWAIHAGPYGPLAFPFLINVVAKPR